MNASMQDDLEAYCRRRFPEKGQLQVKDFRSLTGGWENEVYAFDLEYGPPEDRQSDQLILRVYPGDHADFKSQREFHAMRKLHTAGYPVPYVHILEKSDSPFSKPFLIMDWVEGQLLSVRMSTLPEAERAALRTRFCQLLVRLHHLDWRPFKEEGTNYEADNRTSSSISIWRASRRYSRSGASPVSRPCWPGSGRDVTTFLASSRQ